jgi:hypothetical protein
MAELRTALFSRKQSGGFFVVDDIKQHPGAIWFVDSGHSYASDAAGFGRTPDAPLATLDYAVGLCTASQGDVIYAMPGHAETVSAAAGLDLDKIGISIIGLGNGTLQPTITLDTADTADIDIDAASITIENIHFISNFLNIAAAIDVNATDFTLRNCRFSEAGTDLNALIWIQDAAAAGSDRITVENCHVIANDTTNTHFINFAGTGSGHRFIGNELIGDWGTIAVGGAGVILNAVIRDNVIYNLANTNDSCLNFANTATGLLMRNLAAGTPAAANGITAAAMGKAENYYVDLGTDVQAILEPVVT